MSASNLFSQISGRSKLAFLRPTTNRCKIHTFQHLGLTSPGNEPHDRIWHVPGRNYRDGRLDRPVPLGAMPADYAAGTSNNKDQHEPSSVAFRTGILIAPMVSGRWRLSNLRPLRGWKAGDLTGDHLCVRYEVLASFSKKGESGDLPDARVGRFCARTGGCVPRDRYCWRCSARRRFT